MIAVASILVQYLIPCTVVGYCYFSVCRYLTNRPVLASDNRQQVILAKRKRNNHMLIMSAVAHFLCWLPLNVVNLIINIFDTDEEPLFEDTEDLLITYAVCHLASMISVVINPILYGFMNENFRAEFSKIIGKCFASICCNGNANNNTNHGNDFRLSERERLGEHQSRGKPLQKAAIANDMPNDVIDENNVEEAAV